MEEKQTKLKELYLDAFDDGENYADFFLHNYYTGSNVITYEQDGKLISALYVVDKQAKVRGAVVPFPFLSAVATRSAFRGKKLIVRVMNQALSMLWEQKVPFAALYPFSHRYYQQYGFVTVDGTTEQRVVFNGCNCEFFSPNAHQLHQLYVNYCKNLDGYILRDEARYAQLLADWGSSGNSTVMLRANGRSCYVSHTSNQIEECLGDYTLLDSYSPLDGLTYNVPFGKTQNTMARIVNVISALNCVNCATDGEICFALTDKFLPRNDGVYTLKIERGIATASKTPDAMPQLTLDIEQLTQLLLCGEDGNETFAQQKFFCIDKY